MIQSTANSQKISIKGDTDRPLKIVESVDAIDQFGSFDWTRWIRDINQSDRVRGKRTERQQIAGNGDVNDAGQIRVAELPLFEHDLQLGEAWVRNVHERNRVVDLCSNRHDVIARYRNACCATQLVPWSDSIQEFRQFHRACRIGDGKNGDRRRTLCGYG